MTTTNRTMQDPTLDDEVPNWSPWLRHCRGQHGRIISAAERRAEYLAEAERQRAITREYGGAS